MEPKNTIDATWLIYHETSLKFQQQIGLFYVHSCKDFR